MSQFSTLNEAAPGKPGAAFLLYSAPMIRTFLALLLLAVASQAQASPLDGCPSVPIPGMPTPYTATLLPVCHKAYAALIDPVAKVPRVVAYTITRDLTLGCLPRGAGFHPEEQLPPYARARPGDYTHSGYDQGHMAPAEDMSWDAEALRDSFSMANMAPQLPGLNRAQWERLEETVRARAWQRGALAVYVGTILPADGPVIGPGRVAVPSAFWKVLVDLRTGEAVAFIMPQSEIKKGRLEPWQVSIRQVQEEADLEIPLLVDMNIAERPPIWGAQMSSYRKAKRAACGR